MISLLTSLILSRSSMNLFVMFLPWASSLTCQSTLTHRLTQFMSRLGVMSQHLGSGAVTSLHTLVDGLSGCQVRHQGIYGCCEVQSGSEFLHLLLGAVVGLSEEVSGTLKGVFHVLEEKPLVDGLAVGQLVHFSQSTLTHRDTEFVSRL